MKVVGIWLAIGTLLALLFVGVYYSPAPKTKDIPWNVREGHS